MIVLTQQQMFFLTRNVSMWLKVTVGCILWIFVFEEFHSKIRNPPLERNIYSCKTILWCENKENISEVVNPTINKEFTINQD